MTLEEKEELFGKLLRSFPNGSVNVFDRELRYVLAEGKGLEKAGLSPEDLVGRRLDEIFPPEAVAATAPFYRKAFAGEEGEFEFSWGGRTYATHAAPLKAEAGQVTQIIVVALDITERKRIEDERERAEARNRFLVRLDDAIRPLDDPAEITLTAARLLGEHLAVDRCAYADIEADEDTMNLAGNYLRGPAIKSIVGRLRFADFGAEVLQLMRADKPYVVNDVDTHTPPVGDPAAYRATQIQAVICVPLHKAGRFVAAMAVHMATPRVWTADEVELVRVVAARCWESIERARVARVLRESEERFRAMADNIPQLAWMASPDGHIFWYNRRWYEYVGATPQSQEGWGWQSAHHPDMLPKVLEEWKKSITTGEPFNMVFPLKGADGVFRPFLTRVRPVKDEQGRVVRWFGTNTDVTEQRAAEEALREADRHKNEFLAMLAHELRNPLAPIRNAVEVLKRSGATDSNVRWSQEVIDRQLGHLTRLVDDLLDVSRITRGKIELRQEEADLGVVIERAIEASRPLLDERRQQLVVSLPPEPLSVEGDVTRLAQVFANLLNNAAKYTHEGGHIYLTAERAGEEVVTRVRDDGMGISAETLPHVFDLFIQADRSLDRAQGGLGIGLTLVKKIVEMHAGRVEAFSAGSGLGSEFVVHLPAAALKPSRPSVAANGTQRIPIPRRILVVDDNLDSAESLSLLLRLEGHEVEVAHDGPNTLRLAQTFRPQIVLLDIGLPGMDGYEVARRLRSEPESRDFTLIALTGYGQVEDRKRSQVAGFDHHLVKPVDHDRLTSLLVSLTLN